MNLVPCTGFRLNVILLLLEKTSTKTARIEVKDWQISWPAFLEKCDRSEACRVPLPDSEFYPPVISFPLALRGCECACSVGTTVKSFISLARSGISGERSGTPGLN
jgi:hypothetical protein